MHLPLGCFHTKSGCLAKNDNKGVLVQDFKEVWGYALLSQPHCMSNALWQRGQTCSRGWDHAKPSAAWPRKRSCGLICHICSCGDVSVPIWFGPAPRAASWAGASPGKQMAEGGQSQCSLTLPSPLSWGSGGDLDCHTEGCITCNLSIDRITLDRKVNLFCIDKL